jgi:multiple sugar transport system substrate-binding protein
MLLLLAFCCLLCGCHGSIEKNEFAIPETFDTSRDYEITFWAKNDTNMTQVDIYKKAIADFEALYPNVHVELKIYTDYSRIYNDVITNIPTQTTPNVCITYPDHIATYITGDNTVVPLDGLFADKKYGLGGSELLFDGPDEGQIIPKFLAECAIGEQHYAMPYMRSTEACYVNKTYVEALGFTLPEVLTWDFVFEVSEAAMAKDAEGNFLVNGQNVMIPFIYKSTDNMMIQMLRQKGASYSTADGDILIFHDTTREILQEIALHAGTGAFSTFKISSYPANFLNKGQCILAIDSTAGATWMGTHAPLSDIGEDSLVEFETVVMPVPQYDTANPTMISQGPSVCVFNKSDPQEVLASWLFAQYLLTDEVQIAYSQTEGYAPVTSKAQESEVYLDYLSRAGEDNDMYYYVKLDATRLLLDNTYRTFVTPVFNGSASLRNAAGHLIECVTKSMRRKETVDDAYFEKLYTDTVTLYKLDQKSITERADLGELPVMSKSLIGVLGGTWVLIGLYVVTEKIKKRKK